MNFKKDSLEKMFSYFIYRANILFSNQVQKTYNNECAALKMYLKGLLT